MRAGKTQQNGGKKGGSKAACKTAASKKQQEEKEQATEDEWTKEHPYIGYRVKGQWSSSILVEGTVVAFMAEGTEPEDFALWRIIHDDGDIEDLELDEVQVGIKNTGPFCSFGWRLP